jgi:hypothetical protein
MTFVLVRREPTPEMREIGQDLIEMPFTEDGTPLPAGEEAARVFNAMLAASEPPTDAEIDELCQAMWTWGKDFHWNPPAHWPEYKVEEWRNVERDRMRAFIATLAGTKS